MIFIDLYKILKYVSFLLFLPLVSYFSNLVYMVFAVYLVDEVTDKAHNYHMEANNRIHCFLQNYVKIGYI